MVKEQEISNPNSPAETPHVCVFPYPIQGHINPMLQFAKRLAFKGAKVTLLTISDNKSLNVDVFSIADTVEESSTLSSALWSPTTFQEISSKKLPETIRKVEKFSGIPVVCLVYDSNMPWALDIAKDLGIAGASFFTQTCSVSSVYCHIHEGKLRLPLEVGPEEPSVSLPELPPLQMEDLPTFLCDLEGYPLILKYLVAQFSNVEKADWIFFNTLNCLEEQMVKWMESKWQIKPIGPTIPSMYLDKRLEDDKDYGFNLFKPNSETCMNWLDSKQPNSVVYVSFGSLAALGDDQMAELAWGLKTTKTHFLWVVRESEESKLPCNFIEETSEFGLVVKWSPQLEVLANKSVGCFFTHCGWNSTIEALSLGVPMVAMPQWSDQPTNAKFVEDVWKVGVRVRVDEKGMVRREEIERCVREVMEGERRNEIRRNSEKWKKLAKEAVDEGGSSDRNIEEFVMGLKEKSYKMLPNGTCVK